MKAKVNQDACIGCGACVAICDQVFEFNDEGLSTVKKDKQNKIDDTLKNDVREASESCPTAAIEIEE